MIGMTPMEGITAPARRATTPPPLDTLLPDDTPLLTTRRQDGWTAATLRSFT